jgi:hypothetical protein
MSEILGARLTCAKLPKNVCGNIAYGGGSTFAARLMARNGGGKKYTAAVINASGGDRNIRRKCGAYGGRGRGMWQTKLASSWNAWKAVPMRLKTLRLYHLQLRRLCHLQLLELAVADFAVRSQQATWPSGWRLDS